MAGQYWVGLQGPEVYSNLFEELQEARLSVRSSGVKDNADCEEYDGRRPCEVGCRAWLLLRDPQRPAEPRQGPPGDEGSVGEPGEDGLPGEAGCTKEKKRQQIVVAVAVASGVSSSSLSSKQRQQQEQQ